MIARLEITYTNGSTDVIVSDRSWRTALGAYVTDAWYSGSDYDARREPVGWDQAGADLSATAKRRDGSAVGWVDAGIAPPPNLATKLVARDAPPVRIVETFEAEERHQPGARDLGVRLRPEHRRLAAAEPDDAGAGRHRDPDVARRGPARQRHRVTRPRSGRRRPRARHVQHVHRGRSAAPRRGTRTSSTSGCSGSR